jgi:hypothetical protein
MSLLLAQSTLPPPASIREKAAEVVSRPYFQLDSSRPGGTPLVIQFVRWILSPFIWLFDQMEGVPDVLRWLIVILCVLMCIALVAHIIYTLATTISGPLGRRRTQYDAASHVIDPHEFEMQAELTLAKGDYIGAIRLLFRAALRRLEIFEKKRFRLGITNRELVRRYRATPLADSLIRFANTIDLKWYGQTPCEQADYLTCRNEHGRICQYIHEARPVDNA